VGATYIFIYVMGFAGEYFTSHIKHLHYLHKGGFNFKQNIFKSPIQYIGKFFNTVVHCLVLFTEL
jgi:hypothetical protein